MNNNDKKDVRVNIKLTSEQRDAFATYCKDNGTTISDEIRRYIVKCIKNNK